MEITVESRRLVLRRNPTQAATADAVRVWCAECPPQIPLLTPDEAAALACVSTRTIYRWVESQQVHYLETSGGRLLVCPNSLPTLIRPKEKNDA